MVWTEATEFGNYTGIRVIDLTKAEGLQGSRMQINEDVILNKQHSVGR